MRVLSLFAAVCLSLALLAAREVSSQCDTFCTCFNEQADCTAREALDFRFTTVPVVPPTTTELYVHFN